MAADKKQTEGIVEEGKEKGSASAYTVTANIVHDLSNNATFLRQRLMSARKRGASAAEQQAIKDQLQRQIDRLESYIEKTKNELKTNKENLAKARAEGKTKDGKPYKRYDVNKANELAEQSRTKLAEAEKTLKDMKSGSGKEVTADALGPAEKKIGTLERRLKALEGKAETQKGADKTATQAKVKQVKTQLKDARKEFAEIQKNVVEDKGAAKDAAKVAKSNQQAYESARTELDAAKKNNAAHQKQIASTGKKVDEWTKKQAEYDKQIKDASSKRGKTSKQYAKDLAKAQKERSTAAARHGEDAAKKVDAKIADLEAKRDNAVKMEKKVKELRAKKSAADKRVTEARAEHAKAKKVKVPAAQDKIDDLVAQKNQAKEAARSSRAELSKARTEQLKTTASRASDKIPGQEVKVQKAQAQAAKLEARAARAEGIPESQVAKAEKLKKGLTSRQDPKNAPKPKARPIGLKGRKPPPVPSSTKGVVPQVTGKLPSVTKLTKLRDFAKSIGAGAAITLALDAIARKGRQDIETRKSDTEAMKDPRKRAVLLGTKDELGKAGARSTLGMALTPNVPSAGLIGQAAINMVGGALADRAANTSLAAKASEAYNVGDEAYRAVLEDPRHPVSTAATLLGSGVKAGIGRVIGQPDEAAETQFMRNVGTGVDLLLDRGLTGGSSDIVTNPLGAAAEAGVRYGAQKLVQAQGAEPMAVTRAVSPLPFVGGQWKDGSHDKWGHRFGTADAYYDTLQLAHDNRELTSYQSERFKRLSHLYNDAVAQGVDDANAKRVAIEFGEKIGMVPTAENKNVELPYQYEAQDPTFSPEWGALINEAKVQRAAPVQQAPAPSPSPYTPSPGAQAVRDALAEADAADAGGASVPPPSQPAGLAPAPAPAPAAPPPRDPELAEGVPAGAPRAGVFQGGQRVKGVGLYVNPERNANMTTIQRDDHVNQFRNRLYNEEVQKQIDHRAGLGLIPQGDVQNYKEAVNAAYSPNQQGHDIARQDFLAGTRESLRRFGVEMPDPDPRGFQKSVTIHKSQAGLAGRALAGQPYSSYAPGRVVGRPTPPSPQQIGNLLFAAFGQKPGAQQTTSGLGGGRPKGEIFTQGGKPGQPQKSSDHDKLMASDPQYAANYAYESWLGGLNVADRRLLFNANTSLRPELRDRARALQGQGAQVFDREFQRVQGGGQTSNAATKSQVNAQTIIESQARVAKMLNDMRADQDKEGWERRLKTNVEKLKQFNTEYDRTRSDVEGLQNLILEKQKLIRSYQAGELTNTSKSIEELEAEVADLKDNLLLAQANLADFEQMRRALGGSGKKAAGGSDEKKTKDETKAAGDSDEKKTKKKALPAA